MAAELLRENEAQFIYPVINSFIDVVKMQSNIDMNIKNLTPKSFPLKDIALGSTIELKSSLLNGELIIYYNKEIFLKIYSQALGEVCEEITIDTQDFAAEILNMTYGQAKAELVKFGYDFGRAFPRVLHGDELNNHVVRVANNYLVELESNYGPIFLELIVSI